MEILRAAKEGDVVLLKKLIQEDSTLTNSRDESGQYALHLAIQGKQLECFEELLQNGADVNVVDCDNKTPLHYTAENRWNRDVVTMMSRLIEKGVEVDAKDKDEATPLHLSCKKGTVDAVKFLLNQKASIQNRDRSGKDALLYAVLDIDQDTSEVLRLLIEEYGANVSSVCNDGMTPLMYAAQMLNETAVQCLLRYGANVNVLNDKGESALYMAVRRSNSDEEREIIHLLCKSGADLNILVQVRFGVETPLVAATQSRNTETMKVLLQYGSGLHPELKQLIGGECVRFSSDVYVDILLVVAGVFVNKPWRHYFSEYIDVLSKSQVMKEYRNDADSDKDSDDEDNPYPFNFPEEDSDEYQINLRKLCRFNIRCHLMANNRNRNLFWLVPKLRDCFPSTILEFLL